MTCEWRTLGPPDPDPTWDDLIGRHDGPRHLLEAPAMLATIRKSLAAGVAAASAAVVTAAQDGTVTGPEWLTVAAAAVVAGYAVWQIPNAPAE